MENKPKKHHYVQRAYLHRWSDKDGNIYICDLSNGKVHKGPAKSAAWEKYYYCPEDPEHPENKYEIEEFLANDIEGPAGPVFDKLDQEVPLTTDDKAQLALYAAFQKTRVPFFQKFSDDIAGKLVKEGLIETLRDEDKFAAFLRDSEGKYDKEKIPSREELLATVEENRLKLTYPRAHSLRAMLMLSIPLSEIYQRAQWILSEAEEGKFITSDNPVVTISLAEKEGGAPFTETILPISPKHCLFVDQNSRGTFGITAEDLEGVNEVNRRVFLHATRFLFGNDPAVLTACYDEYKSLELTAKTIQSFHLTGEKEIKLGQKLFMRRTRQF